MTLPTSETHQNPDDKRVADIINEKLRKLILPIYSENITLLNFSALKTFNRTFRHDFLALDVTNRKPIMFKSDAEGKGGAVEFATS